MGLLDRFRRKKKKDDDLFAEFEKMKKEKTPEKTSSTQAQPKTQQTTSSSDIGNLRAKLDLILTEIDSVKTQNQNMNERLKAIEKAIIDMKGIKYY